MATLKKQTKVIIYSYVIYIFISIALVVAVNHFGLKAIDGIRAFTSGQSFYIKAQQDAARNLTNYVFTANEIHYKDFLNNLQIPINDSLARLALDSNKNEFTIQRHLLLGRNRPEDVANIIWVYRNFSPLSRFQKAIRIWKDADVLVIDLEAFGKKIHQRLNGNVTISQLEREKFAKAIDFKCRALTKKGDEFDKTLSDNIKVVNRTVLTLNTLIALIIFICIIGLSVKYIHKLSVLQKDTLAQNEILSKTNEELDLFTHSVSHDLRSPITSLKGIIALAEAEEQAENRKGYFSLMKQILTKQDEFIMKIILFSKNKRTEIYVQDTYLPSFFENIATSLQYGLDLNVNIEYDIAPITIRIDTFRLDIICRNLISNGLKYADPRKKNRFIRISSKLCSNMLLINFEDNGIGIAKEHLPHIFDMFYVTSHQNKGSGIGLYLTKEMLNKLGGEIEVYATPGQGSTFAIRFPINS